MSFFNSVNNYTPYGGLTGGFSQPSNFMLAGSYMDPDKIKTLKELLGDPLLDPDSQREAQRRLLEMQRGNVFGEKAMANPSFDITGQGGDQRRKRRNLSPGDVDRLINAYPDDADKIKQMYLPGPRLPGV